MEDAVAHPLLKIISKRTISGRLAESTQARHLSNYEYLKSVIPNSSYAFAAYKMYGTYKNFCEVQKQLTGNSQHKDFLENKYEITKNSELSLDNYASECGLPFTFLRNPKLDNNTLNYLMYCVKCYLELNDSESVKENIVDKYTVYELPNISIPCFCVNDDRYHLIDKMYVCIKDTGAIYLLSEIGDDSLNFDEAVVCTIRSCHFKPDIKLHATDLLSAYQAIEHSIQKTHRAIEPSIQKKLQKKLQKHQKTNQKTNQKTHRAKHSIPGNYVGDVSLRAEYRKEYMKILEAC